MRRPVIQAKQMFWLAGCSKQEKDDILFNLMECIEDDVVTWFNSKRNAKKPFTLEMEFTEVRE